MQCLQEHAHLFQEPKGLPLHRSFNHSITLLPGAKPINLRPYRYAPKQKDEIEKQVKEMLQYKVVYKKGLDNKAADALSRRTQELSCWQSHLANQDGWKLW